MLKTLQVAPNVRCHEISMSQGLSIEDMHHYIFAHKHYFLVLLSAIDFMNECCLQFEDFHVNHLRFHAKTGFKT